MSIKKMLLKTKKATGGLVVIIVSILGAMSLNYSVQLSSGDMARSVCDEAAHFVAFRAASYFYNANTPTGYYTNITDSNGNHMDFKKEYNEFLASGFSGKVGKCSHFTIHWNNVKKEATTYKVDGVTTIIHSGTIVPEPQSVIIE